MSPLYEVLEARKRKYDPQKELADVGAYGAYTTIVKKITGLFEGTLYHTVQTGYVKSYFIDTLLDVANIALFVVTLIDSHSTSSTDSVDIRKRSKPLAIK